MKPEDKLEDPAGNITSMKPEGDKVHLTQLYDSKDEFLHKTFIPMNSAERRQFRQQYIIPDTPFTTSPCLDMVMVVECPKSTSTELAAVKDPGAILRCCGTPKWVN